MDMTDFWPGGVSMRVEQNVESHDVISQRI